ncbi:Phenylacetic acid catabolic protein [Haladaptatus halobius]|uniref:Phenylacetic acid catabolic protein n=1 Tax=Haladaptatus halobius TaxID=2884875 RepID=UPI001D0B7949|nr:Phenylacetic acid catabolic protein [Haladaptatus halobius]
MNEWPEGAVEYVQAITDTKLLLSHRYAEWMLTGPSLEDDIGGASAAQDEVGHVRQLIRLLEQQGRETDWLEGDRELNEFRNATTLDTSSETWVEHLTTVATADRAAWYLLDSITSDDFTGLVEKIGEDEYFHLEYHDARLATLARNRPNELESAFKDALSKTLVFIGPVSYNTDSDPLVQAGFVDRSAAELRTALLSHYEKLFDGMAVSLDDVNREAPPPDEWDATRRRVENGVISQSVVDSLTGVQNKEFAVE